MANLRDEVINDPIGRGYVSMTNQGVLDSLHVKDRSRNRDTMSGREVKKEVPNSEYDALTVEKKTQFLSLTASDNLDPFGLDANVVKDIFGGGSTTVSNLLVFRVETIDRETELGLSNVKVGHIELVRN